MVLPRQGTARALRPLTQRTATRALGWSLSPGGDVWGGSVKAPCLQEGTPAPSSVSCQGVGSLAEASPGWTPFPRGSQGRSSVLPLKTTRCHSMTRGRGKEQQGGAGRGAASPGRSCQQRPAGLRKERNQQRSHGPAEASHCWPRGAGSGGRRQLGQRWAKQTFALWFQNLQHKQRFCTSAALAGELLPLEQLSGWAGLGGPHAGSRGHVPGPAKDKPYGTRPARQRVTRTPHDSNRLDTAGPATATWRG